MQKAKTEFRVVAAAMAAVLLAVAVLTLTASSKAAEADSEATLVGTYSVVANLSAPAEVIPLGMDAYLTNANNPIEGTGTPTTPVTTANATLYQYSDGTYELVLSLVNRVFTLQTMGSSGTNATATATAWASDLLFASGLAFDDAPTTRISQVTFTLTARQDSYTFSGCDLYATALDYYIDDTTLTLTVDFSDVPEYVAEEEEAEEEGTEESEGMEESEESEGTDDDATATPDGQDVTPRVVTSAATCGEVDEDAVDEETEATVEESSLAQAAA